jgi:hypothetical protein
MAYNIGLDILERAIKSLSIPDLDITKEYDTVMDKFRVRLFSRKWAWAYHFEIDGATRVADFEHMVIDRLKMAIQQYQVRVETLEYSPSSLTYDHPYQLAHQEEIGLAEELQKVKEGFYKNVQRDRRGNRIKPEDVDRYKKLDGFGDF